MAATIRVSDNALQVLRTRARREHRTVIATVDVLLGITVPVEEGIEKPIHEGLTKQPGKRHISAAVEPKPAVVFSNQGMDVDASDLNASPPAPVVLNAPCRRCGHPVGKHHKQENGKSPCILMGCNCSEYRSPA